MIKISQEDHEAIMKKANELHETAGQIQLANKNLKITYNKIDSSGKVEQCEVEICPCQVEFRVWQTHFPVKSQVPHLNLYHSITNSILIENIIKIEGVNVKEKTV